MQRITITLEDELLGELDRIIAVRGYQNRSEAIRDLARAGLRQAAGETGEEGEVVGALVYVYDHEARELAKRLARGFHRHHDLSVASLHVHLSHESCLEVAVLKGQGGEIRQFADSVIAERGVRHGQLVLVPVDLEAETHSHDGEHRHSHVRVRQAG
jgi:CopG family transcriptional regulator, nickel-responsive regulator